MAAKFLDMCFSTMELEKQLKTKVEPSFTGYNMSIGSFETLLIVVIKFYLFFVYNEGNWRIAIGCWLGPLSRNGSQSPGEKKLLSTLAANRVLTFCIINSIIAYVRLNRRSHDLTTAGCKKCFLLRRTILLDFWMKWLFSFPVHRN